MLTEPGLPLISHIFRITELKPPRSSIFWSHPGPWVLFGTHSMLSALPLAGLLAGLGAIKGAAYISNSTGSLPLFASPYLVPAGTP
jgi:hypothetical protein